MLLCHLSRASELIIEGITNLSPLPLRDNVVVLIALPATRYTLVNLYLHLPLVENIICGVTPKKDRGAI